MNYTSFAMTTVIPSISIQPRSPQGEFANEPFVDFKAPENARAMKSALEQVASQLGREYDLVIGGQRLKTEGQDSLAQSGAARAGCRRAPEGRRGARREGDGRGAQRLRVLEQGFDGRQGFAAAERGADHPRAQVRVLAWLTYEVGKNWAEADADVGETIDFLEFYAREALRLAAATTPIQYPGERNELLYIPLGVGAVIPPWNFPFAIMAGMTAAAIVTGNTVILKPSSDAPTIAAKFVEVLEEAGMPDGVVNFCPGSGATFGNAIVEHPKTRFIAFTGSKAVGLEIHERAAKAQPGQIWIKRTILEMGGKDSILVCADADLDAAVEGVVASAFGFSGQKCSACSRAIIEAPVYDVFVERLRERVAQADGGRSGGQPQHGSGDQQGARSTRCLATLRRARRKAGWLRAATRLQTAEGGYFLEPTVFADMAPDAALAQEEIFGPVLAVIKVESFEEGLKVANNTEYGLTGSIYSTDREKLDRARREFHVGNLYFNRKCTGAMVGAHPFGGFNMSGTDSKAGGPDYLYLFTQAKSVAEKL